MNPWVLVVLCFLGFAVFVMLLVKVLIPNSKLLQSFTLAIMKRVVNYIPDDQLKEVVQRKARMQEVLNDPEKLLKKLKESNRTYEDGENKYIPKIVEEKGIKRVVIVEEKLPVVKEPKIKSSKKS